MLVFSGDNGGPEIEGHWNGGLRGGKWPWFEGGVRPALDPAQREAGLWLRPRFDEAEAEDVGELNSIKLAAAASVLPAAPPPRMLMDQK
mgnify:CR=1 FL=1